MELIVSESDVKYTVLFICKENSARSLMAEAILNHFGEGRFTAYSAGTAPAETANPIAIDILEEEGFTTSELRPKHYSVFLEDDAPYLDFVITLSTDTEEEAEFNIWSEVALGTVTANWHFEDPSEHHYDEATEREKLKHVQLELSQRLKLFILLSDEKLRGLIDKQMAKPEE